MRKNHRRAFPREDFSAPERCRRETFRHRNGGLVAFNSHGLGSRSQVRQAAEQRVSFASFAASACRPGRSAPPKDLNLRFSAGGRKPRVWHIRSTTAASSRQADARRAENPARVARRGSLGHLNPTPGVIIARIPTPAPRDTPPGPRLVCILFRFRDTKRERTSRRHASRSIRRRKKKKKRTPD